MISSDKKYIDQILKISDKKDIIGKSPFTKFYVYIVDNSVVSFLIFDDIYDRIEIIYVFTKKEFRNKKYALMLFNKLISEYKEKEYKNITLEVRCDNNSAINLYNKLNFKVISRRINYYNCVDGLLMELEI